MNYSILYCRSNGLFGRVIQAFSGDDIDHVGIRLGNRVLDVTPLHGVRITDYEDWSKKYNIVAEDILPVVGELRAAAGIEVLVSYIGSGYDFLEILGFAFWRKLGSSRRFVCSSLGAEAVYQLTGLAWPGKAGRITPRHLRLWTAGLATGYGLSGKPEN